MYTICLDLNGLHLGYLKLFQFIKSSELENIYLNNIELQTPSLKVYNNDQLISGNLRVSELHCLIAMLMTNKLT